MATSYVEGEADLLIGDLVLSSKIDVQLYITAAAEEMETWLSKCYVVPLPSDPEDNGDKSTLRYIHQHLATSKLLFGLTGAIGREGLNETAGYLAKMAKEKAESICGPTATTSLVSVERRITAAEVGPGSVSGSTLPRINNIDSESAANAFDAFTRGTRTRSVFPGDLS